MRAKQNSSPSATQISTHINGCYTEIIPCVFITLLLILLITYLVIESSVTKSPSFQVASLSLTNFTSSSVSVTGAWHISFLAQNRNKNTVLKYGPLGILVYYQNGYITGSEILPFRQESGSKTALDITIPALDVKVGQFFSNAMKEEMKARGSIGFKVKIDGSVTYKPRHFFTEQVEISIICDGLQVNISSNTSSSGELIGGPYECQTHTHQQN